MTELHRVDLYFHECARDTPPEDVTLILDTKITTAGGAGTQLSGWFVELQAGSKAVQPGFLLSPAGPGPSEVTQTTAWVFLQHSRNTDSACSC